MKEYVGHMKEGQNDICYITGESIAVVSSSLFEKNLRKTGLEVMFMVYTVDEYAAQKLKKFDGEELNSTTTEDWILVTEMRRTSSTRSTLSSIH